MGNKILTVQDVINFVTSEKEINTSRKISLLRSKIINKEVLEYVKKRLGNLYIEVLDKHKGYIFELMQEKNLKGWCWQTTESALVFFNDDDYLERGYIELEEEFSLCYHSWICFKFNNEEYVFDPCLNILCLKSDYEEVYRTEVLGEVSAERMKKELIQTMLTSQNINVTDTFKEFQSFIKSIVSSKTYKRIEEEVRVDYLEDVNSPFFRNGSGYRGVIEQEKIKKLSVHFYNQIYY